MRFQVPQFIEVEDKIFGPLTIKEFIYLAGGTGITIFLVHVLPLYVAILLSAPVIILALALAFYKINGKPFIFTLEAAIKYFFGSKLYLWRKVPHKKEEMVREEEKGGGASSIYVPRLSDSKLKDLTWSLDINDNMSPGANETMREQ